MLPARPDRIGDLIKQLEAGRAITQKEVDRQSALLVLDAVKSQNDFIREMQAMDDKRADELESME